MLAYPVNNKPIDYTKKVFIQPKLDGVRCLIQYQNPGGIGFHGQVIAYSRTGKEWKNINHILAMLVPFFNKYPNVVLDGELYNHDFKDDFESIISMVRKTKPTDEDRSISRENVQFHCYDIVDETKTFEERNKFIQGEFPNTQYIKCVKTFEIGSLNGSAEEYAKLQHQKNLDKGYEGSIVRTNDIYKCGRSWSLRKFKDFEDSEALLLDWVEGLGKTYNTHSLHLVYRLLVFLSRLCSF